jgi:hypothetical protein
MAFHSNFTFLLCGVNPATGGKYEYNLVHELPVAAALDLREA